MHLSSQTFAPFWRGFYTTVCDYDIAHSLVEGSLIVVSHLDHPAVVYVVVLYAIPSHNTHVLLAATVCVIIGLHTHFWLHTCLPRITHILLSWTVSVLMSQRKQFIRVNRMPYIAHTLIWLIVSFVLPNHKQFIRVNRMLYIAHTSIWMPIYFVPPHRK